MPAAASWALRLPYRSHLALHIPSGIREFSRNGIHAGREPLTALTQPEIDEIVRMRREGMTYPDIASSLGTRSEAAISAARYQFCKATGGDNLVKRVLFLTDAEHEQIAQMRREGKTWREVSQHFPGSLLDNIRISYHRWTARSAEGIATDRGSKKRPWTDGDSKYLLHARDDLQASWVDIARKLDRTPAAAQRRYYSAKLQGNSTRPRNPQKYSEEELEMLVHLREDQRLQWADGLIPGRSLMSIKKQYHHLKLSQARIYEPKVPFTPEEDELLQKMRGERKLQWKEIRTALPGRIFRVLYRRFHVLSNASASPPSGTAPHQPADPK